ncbi:SCO4225 family membrane protein [Streptomyces phaeochromogenes]|uniref:SCO4225 family membrane protein n=1 Tax=Streptomyces phaeochromogenes TaxID=1923 RepID=UPI003686D903
MSEHALQSTVENTTHVPRTHHSRTDPKDPAMPNASRPRRLPRLRRLLALATDNWPARGYLAVFAASVAAMFLFPDSGFAGSPVLFTAPLSFLSVVLPFGPGTQGGGAVEALAVGYWVAWLLLCALVNAAVIGALAARSGTAPSPGAPEPLPSVSDSSEHKGTVTADSAHPRLKGIQALLAPAVDNWLARGYLAVVAAAVGFFLYAAYVLPDPGFAGIWPFMATAPLSILAVLVSLVVSPEWNPALAWLSPLVFSAGAVLAGLFNAVLLGRLARRLRAPEPRPAG